MASVNVWVAQAGEKTNVRLLPKKGAAFGVDVTAVFARVLSCRTTPLAGGAASMKVQEMAVLGP